MRPDAGRIKWLISVAAAVVIVTCTAIPASFSYLTASSDAVVNTFAAGAISLRLDEAELDANGDPTGNRTTRNSYKILPGMTLQKDPTVTVLAGSEECYVFLYLDSQLPEEYFTLNLEDYSDSWLVVAESGDQTIYVYKTTIDASDSEEEIVLDPLFTQITVSEDLTTEQIEALGTRTITVDAFAVQTYGVDQETAIALALEYFQTLYEDVWGTVNSDLTIEGSYEEEEETEEAASEEDEEEEEETEEESEEEEDAAEDDSADGTAEEAAGTEEGSAEDDSEEAAGTEEDAAEEAEETTAGESDGATGTLTELTDQEDDAQEESSGAEESSGTSEADDDNAGQDASTGSDGSGAEEAVTEETGTEDTGESSAGTGSEQINGS